MAEPEKDLRSTPSTPEMNKWIKEVIFTMNEAAWLTAHNLSKLTKREERKRLDTAFSKILNSKTIIADQ